MPQSSSAAPVARRRPPSLVGFFIAMALVASLGFLPQVWASYRGAAAVPAPVVLLQFLMMFGPGIVALVWVAREDGRRGVVALLRGVIRWRVHPALYAAVLLGPLAANVVAILAARALGAAGGSLRDPAIVLPAFATSFLVYLLLNTEELAWRGYAWPRLRDRIGHLPGALLLGVIWGALHFPLFVIKGGHPGGWPPALFLAMAVAFSVLFALAWERSRGSILIVHLLHQAINAWGEAVPVYPRVTGSVLPAAIMVSIAALLAAVLVRRAGWRWVARSSGVALTNS